MAMVSIVMPVYNGENYLERSVSSVRSQTYSDFELILVDNNSKDDSYAVCKRFAEEDQRIILLEENKPGPGCARNRGLREVHGEYVTFLDCDDFWEPDYLEKMVASAQMNTEANLVVCGRFFDKLENGSGQTKTEGKLQYQKQIIDREEIQNNPNVLFHYSGTKGPVCKLLRADLIRDNRISFPESIMMMEDLCFCMVYLSYVREVILIDNVLYHQVVHQNSLSKSSNIDDAKVWSAVIREVERAAEEAKGISWTPFVKETAIGLPMQYVNYHIRMADGFIRAVRLVSSFLKKEEVEQYISEQCADSLLSKMVISRWKVVRYCFIRKVKLALHHLNR